MITQKPQHIVPLDTHTVSLLNNIAQWLIVQISIIRCVSIEGFSSLDGKKTLRLFGELRATELSAVVPTTPPTYSFKASISHVT